MRGYPKTLNSKEDYLYVKEHFTKEEWSADWQALLDTMKDYFFVRFLETSEVAPTGENFKVVEPAKEGELRALYELRVNPTCKLYRLDFTEEEVKAALQ